MSIGECSVPSEGREFALRLCDKVQEEIIGGEVDFTAIPIQLASRQAKMDAWQAQFRFLTPGPRVELRLPETGNVLQIAQAISSQLRVAVEADALGWFDMQNVLDAGRRKAVGEDSPRFRKLLSERHAGIGIGLILEGATGDDVSRILREKKPEILEIMAGQRAELEVQHGPAWL